MRSRFIWSNHQGRLKLTPLKYPILSYPIKQRHQPAGVISVELLIIEVAEINSRYQRKFELHSEILPVWVDVVCEGNRVGDSFEVIWVEIIIAEKYF